MYRSFLNYIKDEKKHKGVSFINDNSLLENLVKPSYNDGYNELLFKDLLKEVAKLPHATKNVFHLYIFEGYTHLQIADMAGITEGTSKWHLSEAKRILREKIHLKNISWKGKLETTEK
jgi:RNA polymerase sigma-70 factor (ECF subfamily)